MTDIPAALTYPHAPARRDVLGPRCVAWLIDALLLTVIMLPLWLAMMLLGVVTLGLGFAALSLLPAVPFLYTLLWTASSRHATPGQQAMGLVVRRQEHLGPPGAAQALIWTIGYTVTILAGMIWMAVALITTRNRTLHDLAAGLVVVHRREVREA